MALNKVYFTTNGTWTCPSNVTEILVIAAGGGGGGAGGGVNGQFGGAGGGGSAQCVGQVSTVPGAIYNIVIGAGGSGGNGVAVSNVGNAGLPGSDTIFKDNNQNQLFIARGADGGSTNYIGGNNFRGISSLSNGFSSSSVPGGGGNGGPYVSAGKINFANAGFSNGNFTGGVAGLNSGTNSGGGGGGAGPAGNGGNGGAGGNQFINGKYSGGNGANAVNNSGAGGGGGGAGAVINGTGLGGSGGKGGSGYLYVLYVTDATTTSGTAGGDLLGSYPNPTIGSLQGNAISLTALGAGQTGYVLEWNGTTWVASSAPPPGGLASGDLSGSYPNPTVAKINGTTITTAGGALTTGQVLRITSISSSDWGALDLANVNAVTGVLPLANQALQTITLTGDATGSGTSSFATTVAKINGASVPASGALTTGNVLQVNGASSLTYGPINLAGGINYVTGNLPVSNVAPGTSGQIFVSNATPATTWTSLINYETVHGRFTSGGSGTDWFATLGPFPGNETTNAALYLLPNGSIPGLTNYALQNSAAGTTAVNNPVLAGGLQFLTGGTSTKLYLIGTRAYFGDTTGAAPLIIDWATANQTQLITGSAQTSMIIGTTIAGATLDLLADAGARVMRMAGGTQGGVALGPAPAASGHMRSPTGITWNTRNSANTGDANLLTISSDNISWATVGYNSFTIGSSIPTINLLSTSYVAIETNTIYSDAAQYIWRDNGHLQVGVWNVGNGVGLNLTMDPTTPIAFAYTARATDAATLGYTFTTQAPLAVGAVTNLVGGDFKIDIPASVGAGAKNGGLKVTYNSTQLQAMLGSYGNNNGGALWLGLNAVAPDNTNWSLYGNYGGGVIINSPAGNVQFRINNATQLGTWDASRLTLGGALNHATELDLQIANANVLSLIAGEIIPTAPTIAWVSAAASPTITQAANATGAGQTMTVAAQDAHATSGLAGGTLTLKSGVSDGTGFQGTVQINPTSTFITAAGANSVQFTSGAIQSYATTFQWIAGAASPTITQVQAAAGSGQAMLIAAQTAAAASNGNGGDLKLEGGSKDGTGHDGYVVFPRLAGLGSGYATISNTGAIGFSSTVVSGGVAPGTAGQVFITNATPASAWTSLINLELTHGRFTSGGSGTDWKTIIGPLVGSETTASAIYLLPTATAASGSNYSIAANSSSLYLVAPSGGAIRATSIGLVLGDAGGTALVINTNSGAGTNLEFAAGVTPAISQDAPISATAAGANFTIGPQAGGATSGTPGSFIVNFSAPNGGSAETAGFVVQRASVTRSTIEPLHGKGTFGGGGTDFKAVLGPLTGFETTYSALWLLANADTPTVSNPTLYTNGTDLYLSGPSNRNIFFLSGASVTRAAVELTHGKGTFGGGGTDFKAVIGPDVGAETQAASVWLLPTATAAASTNYSIQSDTNGHTYINTPVAGKNIYFLNANAATLGVFDGSVPRLYLGGVNTAAPILFDWATVGPPSQSQIFAGTGQDSFFIGTLKAASSMIFQTDTGGFIFRDTGTVTRASIETTHGVATFGNGGTDAFVAVGPLVGAPTYGALWALAHGTTPTTNNYAFLSEGTNAYFNAPTVGGHLYFRVNNANAPNVMDITTTQAIVSFTNLLWDSSTVAPVISQVTTASAAGQPFTIQAQSSSFAGGAGGNLNLYAGAPGAGGAAPTIHIGDDKLTNVTLGWNATGTTNIQGGILYLQSSAGAGTTYNYTTQFSFITSGGLQTTFGVPQGLWTYDERSSTAGWTLSGLTATSGDIATKNITVTTQAPYASAITHLTAGDFVVNVPLSVGAGIKYGGLFTQYAGTSVAGLGTFAGSTINGALWLGGAAATTPSGTNYSMYGDATYTIVNAPTLVDLRIGNVVEMTLSTTSLLMVVPTIAWGPSVASPTIKQNDLTTASGTGQTLTLQAQNETGTTSTGGALVLTSGTGTTSAGQLKLQTGGTNQIVIGPIAGVNTTTIYTPTVTFERSVASPTLKQDDLTTASGTGQTLTIQAQNETGTTSNGGELHLTSGTGTTIAGAVRLQTGGTDQLAVVTSAVSPTVVINMTPSIVQWLTGTTTPTLKQVDTTGVGATMTVQAQNTSGVGGQAGGNLDLTSGSAASAALAGNVLVQTGGTTRITVAPAGITIGTSAQVNSLVGSYTHTTRLINSTPFTIDTTTTDYILDVDTSGTPTGIVITLPTPTNGRTLILRDITGSFGTNACTLAQHSTEKINGLAASKVLSANWGSWTITSNGTDWFVM